jgi:TolB protein
VFWVYNLADLRQPPRQVRTSCISGPPVAEPGHRHLYIQTRNCDSSPPHQRDLYLVYNLDSLKPLAQTESQDPGRFERLAVAGQADFLFTIYQTASGQDHPLLLDLQGQELGDLKREPYYGRRPAIKSEGQWLYLLRERALAVWRVNDLSLQSSLPFTTTPPADITLSPTAETLYLLGNGWLSALSTSQLQALGLQPVSPLPTAWLQAKNPKGELYPLHVYPSPTFDQDGVAFLELFAPGERYLTKDGGRSWLLFSPPDGPPPSSPNYLLPLSLSPDFAHDQTIATSGLRSTDGGESWAEWSPPLAFTSDRSGNREIYSMNSEGEAVQPLTDHPAADENPAWSPGWTQLAFQSDRSGNWDIFSLRTDCQAECEVQQLTADPADDLLPAWSPDGRSIAFVSTRAGNPEIYVMDREGGNQRRLTFNEAGDWRPAWLRDSQHLIFTSSRNGANDLYQLAVPPPEAPIPTAELELTPLVTDPSDDRDPAVGPDGTIFFLSDRGGPLQVYTYRLSAYNDEVQIEVYSNQSRAEAHPSPRADGSLLVSLEQNGESQVYRLQPYMAALPLTNTPGFNGQPAAGPVWWWPDPAASRE